MGERFTIRKFDGDDCYSWAVFRKDALPKGHRGTVWRGAVRPIVNGCSRSQAAHYRDQLEKERK